MRANDFHSAFIGEKERAERLEREAIKLRAEVDRLRGALDAAEKDAKELYWALAMNEWIVGSEAGKMGYCPCCNRPGPQHASTCLINTAMNGHRDALKRGE